MKFKDKLGRFFCIFLAIILAIIFIPLLLVCALLYLPIGYIKFKRSRYQKDFPRKYSLFSGVHVDNKIYTFIKENDLPIEYYKRDGEYDLEGYFLYKDALLNFSEPFFFDEKGGEWMYLLNNDEQYVESQQFLQGTPEIDKEYESIGEAKERFIKDFRENNPDVTCNKVVFFYNTDNVENCYGVSAEGRMRDVDGFVLYEKDALKETIMDYIQNN